MHMLVEGKYDANTCSSFFLPIELGSSELCFGCWIFLVRMCDVIKNENPVRDSGVSIDRARESARRRSVEAFYKRRRVTSVIHI
jgi:hypothetical protein